MRRSFLHVNHFSGQRQCLKTPPGSSGLVNKVGKLQALPNTPLLPSPDGRLRRPSAKDDAFVGVALAVQPSSPPGQADKLGGVGQHVRSATHIASIAGCKVEYKHGNHHAKCAGHSCNRPSSSRTSDRLPLYPGQQVIVQVIEIESGREKKWLDSGEAKLPDWCNVYDGLSDEEIDRLDGAIQQRLDLTKERS